MATSSKGQQASGELGKGIAFGIINGIMVTPVMISFASIIFRDHAFTPYMPALIKLVLFSSLTHQLCFTLFSSLPFAVGQVQDAGLIFLSSMASSLVLSVSEENLIPTTLFVLCLSTAGLGVMLMLIGKLRLASVVQFLPMPVVGGYLAFIGFFCGQAGLAMMSGIEIMTIADWPKLCNEKSLLLILPGVFCGIGIYVVMMITRSPLSLPVCMIVILSVFYSCLAYSDASLQDARDYGWIAPLSEPLPFYEAWQYYDITAVEWSVIPSQVFRWIGMFLVVAFSSSLDIAAIEMELGLPMDYDRELMTVGVSNLVSGLLGGYTGSYIFSQTLFTMRSGIQSRVCGYTIVLCEVVVLVLPISVTSFIPKFLFGSLLVFISVDLMHEWLIMSRHKMMILEYAVCLFTFVAIQYVGIEVGMLMGILGAMANFVYSYAKKSNVTITALRFSTAVRTFEERAILEGNRGKIVTISLEGFVFFGSAVKLLEEVKRHVVINTQSEESVDENEDVSDTRASTEMSPLLTPKKKKVSAYSSPSRTQNGQHSPSKSSEHSESFSHMVPIYGLTSDQIAHHNKWKQLSNVAEDSNKRNDKKREFVDVAFSPPPQTSSAMGKFANLTLASPQDDEGVQPPPRKRCVSDDYFIQEVRAPMERGHSSSNMLRKDNEKLVYESVLNSVWGAQVGYRQDRIKSSEGSIKKVGSESNLQLHIDKYDQTSPKFDGRKSLDGSDRPTSGPGSAAPPVHAEFMILNFTAVSGVDATAARSCFLMLVQLLRGAGATIVFAIPDEDSISLLKIHGVILDMDKVFSDLEDALEWCEEKVLFRHITARSKVQSYQNEQTNYAFSPRPNKSRGASARVVEDEEKIEFDSKYLASAWNDRHASPNRNIKRMGSYQESKMGTFNAAESIDNRDILAPITGKGRSQLPSASADFDPAPYRVLRRILLDYLEVDPDERCPTPLKQVLHSHTLARFFTRKLYDRANAVYHIDKAAETLYFIEHGVVELLIPDASENEMTLTPATSTRVSKVSTGGVFGDASFFLSSTYTCSAIVTSDDCVVWCLDKKYYALMEVENPQLCIIIQHVLLKSMSMAQASAIHSTHPSSCYSLFFK